MNYSVLLINIVITQRVINRGNKLFIHFIFTPDKTSKLLFDIRYSIHDKFEKKILELNIPETINFVKRREERDRVILEYEKQEVEKYCIGNKFFTISDFVPPYPGCSFCSLKGNEKNGFFECKGKGKTLAEEKENCGIFRQRQLYKT